MNIFKLFGSVFVDTDAADKSLAKTDKNAETLGDKFVKGAGKAANFGKVLGGVALTGGVAILGMAAKGVMGADELQGAMNQLVSATGASVEETKELEESMKNIYANNFGENFEDIADTMALVKTNTGLMGEELEKATERAFLLKDTFGFGAEETTIAVSTMMKQFGISAEEAYEMIAVGAQNGANKNGDLLDIINEYSVQFADLDFNAGTFMETLIDGSEQGIFSMDKVGDAVKEFNIRVKDGSDASASAFEEMGYDADDMFASFAAGGEETAMAMESVIESLSGIEDPLKKNELGVALFGTQFEDVGDDILDVLVGLDGKLEGSEEYINDMTGTLDKMNEVKYDTLGEAFTALGRKMEVGLLNNLQPIMPKLMELVGWVTDHMPEIMEVMTVVFTNIGEAVTFAVEIFNTYLLPVLVDMFEWIKLHMPEIQEFVKQTFENIVIFVTAAWEVFTVYLLPILVTVFKWMVENMPVIKKTFETVFDAIVTVVKAAWDIFENVLLPIFKTVFNWIVDNWDTIRTVFETVFDAVVFAVESVINTITVVYDTIKFLYDFISGVFQGTGDLIESAFSGVTSFIDGIVDKFNAVKDAIGGAIDKVKEFIGVDEDVDYTPTDPDDFYGTGSVPSQSGYYPGLARGGTTLTSGMVTVGEQGKENVFLPKGAQVQPLNNQGGGINLTIQADNIIGQNAGEELGNLITDYLRGQGVIA